MLKFAPDIVIADRYLIHKELGKGGMATVFSALDQREGREVALKVLNPDQLTVERRRARFLKEFRFLKELSHQNIVQVFEEYDLGSDALFFSMELIEGASLDALIKKAFADASTDSAAYYRQALIYLEQIASALEHIHAKGIIFCDLKPANVVIGQAPGSSLKLIDFGIAKKADDQATEEEVSKMIGTSLYMSPEQIRTEKLNPTSDIYSFGVLAFELLTGNVPFQQQTLFNVTASHLIGKVPLAKDLNKALPVSVDRMLQICMSKDARDRYQSFSEILHKLAAFKQEASTKSGWLKRIFLK